MTLVHAQALFNIEKISYSAQNLQLSNATTSFKAFSHDVTSAILVFKNSETAVMLVSLWELTFLSCNNFRLYRFICKATDHVSENALYRLRSCPCHFYDTLTLFTWSGGPRSSGVGFFCFVSRRAWKQKKPTPLDRGPPLHVNRVLGNFWPVIESLSMKKKENRELGSNQASNTDPPYPNLSPLSLHYHTDPPNFQKI